MDVAISTSGPDVAIVAVRGQLDIDTSPRLREAFDELAVVNRIVVDLTDLEFCDSVGLSTFVLAHRRCTDAGGWVHLAGPRPFLVRLLSIIGVAGTVPMYRTVAGARRGDATEVIAPDVEDLPV
jgi:anti-anti-sigma factor